MCTALFTRVVSVKSPVAITSILPNVCQFVNNAFTTIRIEISYEGIFDFVYLFTIWKRLISESGLDMLTNKTQRQFAHKSENLKLGSVRERGDLSNTISSVNWTASTDWKVLTHFFTENVGDFESIAPERFRKAPRE